MFVGAGQIPSIAEPVVLVPDSLLVFTPFRKKNILDSVGLVTLCHLPDALVFPRGF